MAEQIVVLDESKMESKIRDFPNQLEKAWTDLWVKDVVAPSQPVNRILICGMGGSGIAGRLAQELFSDQSIEITPWADYGLPNWVDQHTLVIAVSYSGDTEETIDAVKKAVEKKLPLYLITKGGKLQELAQIHGLPLIEINYDSAPRNAIGYLYGSLITLLAKLKVINFTEKQYFSALDELKTAVKQEVFPEKAEELAITLNNKVPIIVASSPLVSIAYRWVTQINENAKMFASAVALPEFCHNFLVGLDFAIPEKLSVVILESKYAFSRNTARKKIVEKLFAAKDIPVIPLSVASNSLLAEQFLMIHFGDWLSFSLAGVNGIDPTPVEIIEDLKAALKKV